MRAALLALAMVAAPAIASACPVCFGASGAPMAKATNNGIFVLLGIIGFVQLGFVAMFIAFWRRARALRAHRDSFRVIDGGLFR
jgi:Na+/proline symporter